ncbi:hypothetical protein C8R43DRAFT_959521 [Mycena crocata]|nr:hypothetical protein C8R43DRAFT_959521 [Mycena crocata]
MPDHLHLLLLHRSPVVPGHASRVAGDDGHDFGVGPAVAHANKVTVPLLNSFILQTGRRASHFANEIVLKEGNGVNSVGDARRVPLGASIVTGPFPRRPLRFPEVETWRRVVLTCQNNLSTRNLPKSNLNTTRNLRSPGSKGLSTARRLGQSLTQENAQENVRGPSIDNRLESEAFKIENRNMPDAAVRRMCAAARTLRCRCRISWLGCQLVGRVGSDMCFKVRVAREQPIRGYIRELVRCSTVNGAGGKDEKQRRNSNFVARSLSADRPDRTSFSAGHLMRWESAER